MFSPMDNPGQALGGQGGDFLFPTSQHIAWDHNRAGVLQDTLTEVFPSTCPVWGQLCALAWKPRAGCLGALVTMSSIKITQLPSPQPVF